MSDNYPQIRTTDIDVGDDIAMLAGVGPLWDLRVINKLCRAAGTDTLEHVKELLALLDAADADEDALVRRVKES